MTRYRVAPDVAWVEAADGGFDNELAWVAVLPDGPPLTLNGSALLIWEATIEGGSLEEITARVREAVEDPSVPEQEVRQFLSALVSHGLVATSG